MRRKMQGEESEEELICTLVISKKEKEAQKKSPKK